MKNKIIKKYFSCLLAFTTLVAACPIISAYANAYDVIAQKSNSTILVNGEMLPLKLDGQHYYPLIYKDTNYMPVPLAEQLIGKNITWYSDENRLLVSGNHAEALTEHIVETSNIITENNAVFYDTVKLESDSGFNTTTNVLLCEENIFIPVRVLCELSNKAVSYDASRNDVLIRDNLTPEQLSSAKNYVAQVEIKINNLWNIIGNTEANEQEIIRNIRSTISSIAEVEPPEVEYVSYDRNRMLEVINDISKDLMSDTLSDETREQIEYKISALQYYNAMINRFNF